MVSTTQKHALRLEREKRGWSQSRLAELLETSSISISQWERGVVMPSPYFRTKLCTLFEKDAQTLGLLSVEVSSAKPYIFDPFTPVQGLPTSGLIGRDTLFKSLVEQVCALQVPPNVTLYGLPGVGKTALLLALTQSQEIQRHFSEGILWAGLGPHPHLFEQLSRWGHLLQIPSKELKEHRDLPSLARCLRTHIGSRRFLLVLDDVWRLEDALALHIGGAHCAHVVSTRFQSLALQLSLQKTLHIPELEIMQGQTLLTHFLPHLAQREPQMIEQITMQVGMLPLALTLIGRHLAPYDYLQQSQRLQTALQQIQDLSIRLHLSRPQSPIEHHPSIPPEQPISLESVIAVSYQQLSSEAQKTLRYLALLPAKPNSFAKDLVDALVPDAESIINDLIDAGLVETYGQERYTLHQTIADYARIIIQSEDAEQETAKQRLIQYAASWIEKHKEDYEQIELEYSNLHAALAGAKPCDQHRLYFQLVLSFIPFWKTRGQYQQAEKHLQQALGIAQRLQYPKKEIQILWHLGEVARQQVRYDEARAYYQKGFGITQQKRLHSESIRFLVGLSNINIYQGNYKQAEADCRRGLDIAQKTHDQEHLSALFYVQGLLMQFQSRYPEAYAAYHEVLPLAQQTNQRELMVRTFNSLGIITERQGKVNEAEGYYQEGLKLAQEIGYQDYIARLLNGLGVISNHHHDIDQGSVYFQQALLQARQIGHRALITNVLHNLADAALSQKKNDQAETYTQEAFLIAQKIGHAQLTGSVMISLGEIHVAKQQFQQAEAILQEALKAPALSPDLRATALYSLARVAAKCDEITQALDYGKESLMIFQQVGHYKRTEVQQWIKRIESFCHKESAYIA